MAVSAPRQPPARPDPRTYDYSKPERNCDVVMKGGITSGVVYPFAVCELAQTYSFRNVGGASAGAIAAEYGRAKGGFAKLAKLPDWLGGGSNLFDLFQPQPETKPLYRLLVAPIGHKKGKALRVAGAVAANFTTWLLLGAAPGAVALLLFLFAAHGFVRGLGVGLSVFLLVAGAVGAALFGVYRTTTQRLASNGFGLCGGMGESDVEAPALTEWLADMIDDLAGNPPNTSSPLTFGDLWAGPPESRKPESAGANQEKAVNLEMITTSLTLGRPFRLPFESQVWFFDPAEMEQRFPKRIVEWLKDHPAPVSPEPARGRREQLMRRLLEPLRPMPLARDLPVVVATRLSLSFPLLISAMPLHAVDWTRTANIDAGRRWGKWLLEHEGEWERLVADTEAWRQVAKPAKRPEAGVCWFSDGGITSNFPVHFFDAPIPRWPTFAINLRDYHPDFPPTCDECEHEGCDQGQSVWMPDDNGSGILDGWREIPVAGGLLPLITFGHSIVDTMQNWTDNTQLTVPGYRDRVAHVLRTKEEGGINLNMPECRISALTERGRIAGERLAARFSLPTPPDTVLTWNNHRWVRYRTTMALLQGLLFRFRRAWLGLPIPDDARYPAPGDLTYQELLALDPDNAPSYPLDGNHKFAEEQTARIVELSDLWDRSGDFGLDAPNPQPELRIRPRA